MHGGLTLRSPSKSHRKVDVQRAVVWTLPKALLTAISSGTFSGQGFRRPALARSIMVIGMLFSAIGGSFEGEGRYLSCHNKTMVTVSNGLVRRNDGACGTHPVSFSNFTNGIDVSIL